jgi:hypothetical protein
MMMTDRFTLALSRYPAHWPSNPLVSCHSIHCERVNRDSGKIALGRVEITALAFRVAPPYALPNFVTFSSIVDAHSECSGSRLALQT